MTSKKLGLGRIWPSASISKLFVFTQGLLYGSEHDNHPIYYLDIIFPTNLKDSVFSLGRNEKNENSLSRIEEVSISNPSNRVIIQPDFPLLQSLQCTLDFFYPSPEQWWTYQPNCPVISNTS